MSFGNAFLQGLTMGRQEIRNRAEEERKKALEERTQQQFTQRQAGLEDLAGEFGARAYAPGEFASLTSTDKTKQLLPGQLEQQGLQTQGMGLANQANEEALNKQRLMRGARMFQSVAEGAESPGRAIVDAAQNLTPQARQLLGIGDEDSLAQLAQAAENDPAIFGNMINALQAPSTGSKAGMQTKQFVRPDGTVGIGAFDPNTGEFRDMDMNAPRPASSVKVVGDQILGVDAAGNQSVIGSVSQALYGGEQAKAEGREIGEGIGVRKVDQMELPRSEALQTLNIARNMVDNKSRVSDMISTEITPLISGFTTGKSGAAAANDPSSRSAELRRRIDGLNSNLIMDQLLDLKSRGGTLGQVTEKELEVLRTTIANVDPNAAEADVKRALQRVQDQFERSIEKVNRAIQADGRFPQDLMQSYGFAEAAPSGDFSVLEGVTDPTGVNSSDLPSGQITGEALDAWLSE